MPLISGDPYAYEKYMKKRARALAILRYEKMLKRESTLKWLSFKVRVQWFLPLWGEFKKTISGWVDALTCRAILTLITLFLLATLVGIAFVLYKIFTLVVSLF